jgi:hypothetical protein
MTTSLTLTICFDASFWGRVLEIAEAGEVRATRHVFGSEPTDAELHQFLLRHGTALLERAQAVYRVLDCTKTTGTTDVDAETPR